MIQKLSLSIVFLVAAFTASVSIKAQERVRIKPVRPKVDEFMIMPFGYQPIHSKFSENLKSWKMRTYSMKSNREHADRDTFFEFTRKKSKLIVIKSQDQERFVGGKIETDDVELANGVKIGQSRYEFFKSFADLKTVPNDTIILSAYRQPNVFTFVFEKGKLSVIKIGLPVTKKKRK